MLRRLATLLLLAVVLAAVAADIAARIGAQRALAQRLQRQQPGSTVTAQLSGEPFLWNLLADGRVDRLRVQATHYGDLASLRATADQIDLSRQQLFSGRLDVLRLQSLTVDATVDQATVDRLLGQPVSLGAGTVGIRGANLPVSASVAGDRVTVSLGPLPGLTLRVPDLAQLGCDGTAQVIPGALMLHCQTSQVPPFLSSSA